MEISDKKVKVRNGQSKFQRWVIWLLINGVMCYALYMAMVLKNEAAGNIIKFMIWVNFVICLLCSFASKKLKKPLREKGPSVPPAMNLIYGFLYAGALAAFGWFGYATLDIITTFLQAAIYYDEDDK